MITCKLDVTKIDKSKLFKGEKGTYLDIVLIETPNGKYGDWMVCQSVSKEERAAGVRGAILGNGKNFEKRSGGAARPAAKAPPKDDDGDSDIPF